MDLVLYTPYFDHHGINFCIPQRRTPMLEEGVLQLQLGSSIFFKPGMHACGQNMLAARPRLDEQVENLSHHRCWAS